MLEEKQQYLRTQIMDNGYDTTKFYEFWHNRQLDLQLITMEELQSVTTQFKQQVAAKQDDQFGEFHSVGQSTQQHHHDVQIDWSFLEIKNNPYSHNEIKGTHKKIQQFNLLGKDKEFHELKPSIQKIQELKIDNLREEGHQLQSQLLPDHSISIKKVMAESKNQTVKCLQLQKNILDHHINVQITVSQGQVQNTQQQQNSGILKKFIKEAITTVTFLDIPIIVKTIGRNQKKSVGVRWNVTRKRTDFQWLRKMLIKFYPGMVVPPLPNTIRSHEKLPGYLKKLEAFLLDTYRCSQLRNSKYFEVFLSYGSKNDFEAFQKQTENASEPGTLSHVLNMKGQLTLYFGQKVDYYSENLKKYLTSQSNHLKAVKNITNTIIQQYQGIAQQFHDLAGVFIIMSEEAQSFSVGHSDSQQQKCFPKLIQTYRQISSIIQEHSQFCIHQKNFVENYMNSHFSYEKDRLDNMQNLLTKRDYFATQYQKKSANGQANTGGMLGKFTSLFGAKTQSLDVPSSNIQTLKDQVGFYNSQVLIETTRCLQMMIKSYIHHFSNYGDSRIDNVDSMQQIWSKIMVDLSKLNIS